MSTTTKKYPKVEGYPDQADIDWSKVPHSPRDLAIRCPVEGCGLQVGWQHLDMRDTNRRQAAAARREGDELLALALESIRDGAPEAEDEAARARWKAKLERDPGITCEGCCRASYMFRDDVAVVAPELSFLVRTAPLEALERARGREAGATWPQHWERGARYLAYYFREDVVRARDEAGEKANAILFVQIRSLLLAGVPVPEWKRPWLVAYAAITWNKLSRETRRRLAKEHRREVFGCEGRATA
ncbi:MAG TPA: hypothetical protein VNN79_04080 [Actinomycetota bacterium]|nr:hypothetical protein [Actinomycetota bacterium]